jgi:hypothetical protein
MKTEAWLIPAGAKPPELVQKPHKIDFFGRITESDLKKRFVKFLVRLRADPTATGHIIIDGSPTDAAGQAKLIRKIMRVRAFSSYRITIVRGRTDGKPLTELWLIAAGSRTDDIERDENEAQD